jgi:hypothetical protein
LAERSEATGLRPAAGTRQPGVPEDVLEDLPLARRRFEHEREHDNDWRGRVLEEGSRSTGIGARQQQMLAQQTRF